MSYVSLRTVPDILRKGSQKIVVNALLDEAYINSHVAAELNLQGETQKATVKTVK